MSHYNVMQTMAHYGGQLSPAATVAALHIAAVTRSPGKPDPLHWTGPQAWQRLARLYAAPDAATQYNQARAAVVELVRGRVLAPCQDGYRLALPETGR